MARRENDLGEAELDSPAASGSQADSNGDSDSADELNIAPDLVNLGESDREEGAGCRFVDIDGFVSFHKRGYCLIPNFNLLVHARSPLLY